MSKQQTYWAKGTSLFALLLLVVACIAIHSCKTSFRSPKEQNDAKGPRTEQDEPMPDDADSAGMPPLPLAAPSKPGFNLKQTTTDDSSIKTAAPVYPAPARSFSQRAVAATPKPDSTAQKSVPPPTPTMLQRASPIKISMLAADDEIPLLEAALNGERNPTMVLFAGAKSDSTKEKNTAHDKEKLLENTGSGYFNAGIAANMNDQIQAIFSTRLLYDSVIASGNKDFVYNTVTVINNTATKIDLQVIVTGPKGWQMVTSNIANISLDAFASSVIPMRFAPGGNNTATWSEVRIEYRINNMIDTRKNFFRMKVQEYSDFKASLPNANMVLTGYQKNNPIPIYIKNSGNTTGNYAVAAANQLLKLSYNTEVFLQPGKDTTIFVPLSLSESQFAMLKKEDIRIAVANEKKETISLIQAFSKVGHILRDHASAFLDMPLQLEVGTFYQGSGSPTQFYGAIFGTLELNSNNRFAMALRSNTFAQGQTNNNSIVRLEYTGKNVSAILGNIQGAGEFIVDGYGMRVAYDWRARNKVEVFAMLKSRAGDAKVGGIALQLGLRENLRLNQALSVSDDKLRMVKSGILSQILEYKFDQGRFAVISGMGTERNDAPLVEGAKRSVIGASIGYNLQYLSRLWNISSNLLYNSNSYPGMFKGQRLQQHDVRLRLGKHFIGGYFEYNFRQQNYWQDSFFLENVFNVRTTNYGARGGVSIKNSSFILSVGNQQQAQIGEASYRTTYDYLNLNITAIALRKLFVNLTSFVGNMSTINGPKDKVFVSTNQGRVQYKSFGASFRYDDGPFYYQEFMSYLKKPERYSRIIAGPFAEVFLLKRTLNLRAQANYGRTLPSGISNTTIIANVNYATPQFDFNINGIVPVAGSAANQTFLNAAIRMRLKAPFVPIRKYYNLNLVLFKDVNSNGVKDRDEEPVQGQTLSLNGDLFVSDANGLVIYKNTERGTYKADFGYSSRLKGWMPNDGTVQYFELTGNKSIEIPYKVSRVLSGKLIVEKDTLSNSVFNPHNIKVTATGQKGEIYTTLTDENGEFYFNLPAGIYVVSLNEVAFSEQFRPVQFSQSADLVNNNDKMVYFEIKQKRRQINIKKK